MNNMEFTENEETDQGRLMSSSSTLEQGSSSSSAGVDLTLRITTPPSMLADQQTHHQPIVPGNLEPPSHIPASNLIIGAWLRMSKNEGHLTANILYETRKLEWEILEGALKIKIEMNWDDIYAINAQNVEGRWGVLDIQLDREPSFFREFNPQPGKPTTWERVQDFTAGQAMICKRHTVYFTLGTLDEHYKKLLQCDGRLLELSRKPFPSDAFFTQNMLRYSDLLTGFLSDLTRSLQSYHVPNFPPPTNLTLKTGPHVNTTNPRSPMPVTNPLLIDEGVNNQNYEASKAGGNVDLSVMNTSMYQNAPPHDQGPNEGVDLNLSLSTPVFPNVQLPEQTMEEDFAAKAGRKNNDHQGNN